MNTQFPTSWSKLICSLLGCVSVLSANAHPAHAQQVIYMKPTGAYATINTAADKTLMRTLTTGSPDEKARSIKSVLQSPTRFSPGVLFSLSAALSQQGRKDDAIFWFLLADLRARYDAQRCADDSARSGASILRSQFGEFIYPHMRQNTDKLELTIPKVLSWDASHGYDYDQRWINLHGLKVFGAESDAKNQPELSLPKSEWAAIRSKVRADFEQEYKNSLAVLKGKSIKASQSQGKQADADLMKACREADLGAAETALKQGASPRLGETAYTPLHAAATAGSLPICKLLLSRGADVNASTQGTTPLLCAARYCHPEVIEVLLKSKANPNARDSDGLTAIMKLLNNFRRGDQMKGTTSSEKDALTAIKLLLAAGVDPNIGGTFFGTPLTIAASNTGCVEIVRLLLDGGAKVDESESGSTALHLAVSAGDIETVTLLLSRGANVNARDPMKQTPLALAKKKNFAAIQKYLTEHGAKE